MNKKRGMVVLEVAIELLVGTIIFFSLYSAGVQWGKGDIISKINTAKDIGLTIGMLESSTVETYVYYRKDVSKYVIDIKDNCVIVGLGLKDSHPSSYCFPPTNKIKKITLKFPEKLLISKTDEGIVLSDKDIPRTRSNFCGTVATFDFTEKKILIDPLFSEQNDDILRQFAIFLDSRLSETFHNIDTTLVSPSRIEKIQEGEIDRLKKESDIIIEIKIIESKDKNIYAKIDPSNNELDMLNSIACNSLNNLLNLNEPNLLSLSKLPFNDPTKKTIQYEISNSIFDNDEKNMQYASTIALKIGEGITNVFK